MCACIHVKAASKTQAGATAVSLLVVRFGSHWRRLLLWRDAKDEEATTTATEIRQDKQPDRGVEKVTRVALELGLHILSLPPMASAQVLGVVVLEERRLVRVVVAVLGYAESLGDLHVQTRLPKGLPYQVARRPIPLVAEVDHGPVLARGDALTATLAATVREVD